MEATLIDYMGDDLRVVNAARVSFHKESEFGADGLRMSDQKLINYLAKHNHWTPFSHVQITLREKVPIFVARQRFKHMVGFTYNEVSRRYVDDTPEFYTPSVWRGRPVNAKQGSSDEVIDLHDFIETGEKADEKYKFTSLDQEFKFIMKRVAQLYETLLIAGIAPEQARMVLPQSMYTEYYCTGSLAAWARAYKLRIDPHAQVEIQDLAKLWNREISGIKELENSWRALTTTQ